MWNFIIQAINKDIETYGFVGANRKTVERSGTTLTTIASLKTKRIIKKKAVVIVANHPFEVETIAIISSLPLREDIFLIINAMFVGLVKKLDKNLIPVICTASPV